MICLLYRGSPLFRGSVITVIPTCYHRNKGEVENIVDIVHNNYFLRKLHKHTSQNSLGILEALPYFEPRSLIFVPNIWQGKCFFCSLVPRPFPPPVFDRLQYAKMEGEGLGERVTCVTSGRHEGGGARRRILRSFL